MQVEVCVPNAAAFREASEALCGSGIMVTRAGVLAGAHECVAAFGDSVGNFCDPSLPERLSVHGHSTLQQVRKEICAHHGGELPVGSAVVVTTPHPKRWLLIYAAVVDRLPTAAADLQLDYQTSYCALRAVVMSVPESVPRVSLALPGGVPIDRSCLHLLRALSIAKDSKDSKDKDGGGRRRRVSVHGGPARGPT